MFYYMSLQITTSMEYLNTIGSLLWFLFSMYWQEIFQVNIL